MEIWLVLNPQSENMKMLEEELLALSDHLPTSQNLIMWTIAEKQYNMLSQQLIT